MGDKGFNELEMTLLRHLIHNKRPMSFIRTQCDSAIQGIIHDEFNQVSLSKEPLAYLVLNRWHTSL